MNRINRYSVLLITVGISIFLNSCTPFRSYEKIKHPQAPDYSDEKNWVALPWRHDAVDSIPSGCTIPENQKRSEADVFYVYPTSYILGINWNASVTDKKVNRKSTYATMIQASVFNASGKVYVPRYRQAVLKAFIDKEQGSKALDLAYSDVKASFEYYIKHWNKGRPFIIAGHSQGSKHIERLIREFIDGKELQNQLIAAYAIGMPVADTTFKHIPAADSASQINCYISWNTFKWGTHLKADEYFNGGVCINPLTWKRDEVYANRKLNHGGVSLYFKRIDTSVCDAQSNRGILWVHKVSKRGYWSIGKSYHLCDYNLFYMNIRENALLRATTYLSRKNK